MAETIPPPGVVADNEYVGITLLTAFGLIEGLSGAGAATVPGEMKLHATPMMNRNNVPS